ncbi:MAG: hypothetical protein ACLPWS_18245 [Rhodomicrobium sp.]
MASNEIVAARALKLASYRETAARIGKRDHDPVSHVMARLDPRLCGWVARP